jgi:hypothetical protein
MKKPKSVTISLDESDILNIMSYVEVAQSQCHYVDPALCDLLFLKFKELEVKHD